MTIILIQRSERLVTKGELSPKEIDIVKTMLTVGNSIEEVKHHLEKQNHKVIINDREEDLNILFFSTTNFSEKELNEMINAVTNLDTI